MLDRIQKVVGSDYLENITSPSLDQWGDFILKLGFELTRKVRQNRFNQTKMETLIKTDGSPSTDFEFSLESYARIKLQKFCSNSELIGEEHGKPKSNSKYYLIMDPIDGTRSFLAYFDTFSISLAILHGEEIQASIISSPACGDIYFRQGNESSKLITIPLYSKEFQIFDLPLEPNGEEDTILVNIHPSKKAKELIAKNYDLWRSRKIQLVKSISGSPSLSIVKVALGTEYYINMWEDHKTEPYDLLAAMHILNGAKGSILDGEGNMIDPEHHRGMFIAGINKKVVNHIIKLL